MLDIPIFFLLFLIVLYLQHIILEVLYLLLGCLSLGIFRFIAAIM